MNLHFYNFQGSDAERMFYARKSKNFVLSDKIREYWRKRNDSTMDRYKIFYTEKGVYITYFTYPYIYQWIGDEDECRKFMVFHMREAESKFSQWIQSSIQTGLPISSWTYKKLKNISKIGASFKKKMATVALEEKRTKNIKSLIEKNIEWMGKMEKNILTKR